jgi:carbon monoxide dehydrogenase subunit G
MRKDDPETEGPAMTRFEGDRDFALPPDELWAKLTDARFLVTCMPDVESVAQAEPARAVLVLRPGFSFVRGTLDVVLEVADVTASSARVLLHSRGIGSSSEVEASLALAPRDGGASVHWVAEVKSLGGLLKMVPSGLVRGAAQKVVGDAWDLVEKKLTAEA